MTNKSASSYRDSDAIAGVFFGAISTVALFIFAWMYFLGYKLVGWGAFLILFFFVDAICSFISIVMARASLEKSKPYPGTRETGMARTGLVLGMIGALAPVGMFLMVIYLFSQFDLSHAGW